MKKNSIYTLVLSMVLTAFTSCMSSQSPIPVKGSGALVDKNFDVSNFDAIEVSGGFDVRLIQGNSEGLVLSAQENLFEYIVVKVENGVLKIYPERNFLQTKGLYAKINLKTISGLKVSGGGDVTTENILDVPKIDINLSGGGDLSSNLKTGGLKCNISGGGDAKIDGEINNYEINLSGGGDVNSNINSENISCSISGGGDATFKNNAKAENVDVSVSGGGDISCSIEAQKARLSISGGGDATLQGSANSLEVSVSGGGNIQAGEFTTQRTMFKANGGSNIHINATAELSGYISGGGDVYYSGNPGVVNIDAKGGSEVHKE